jgi:hypothetical protein
MTSANQEWSGTFEAWQNRDFGELYSRYTGREVLFYKEVPCFASRRPIIGNLTLYVYNAPNDIEWCKNLIKFASHQKIAKIWIYCLDKLSEFAAYPVSEYLTLVIDLKLTNAKIWDALGNKTRNMVRKGGKSGLTVSEASGVSEFEEWWNIYSISAKKAKFSAQSYSLIKSIFKNKNISKLLVASKDGKVVGGAFFLVNKYPMYWLGAFDRNYSSASPGHLIIWEAICKFQEMGFRLMDLGGIAENEESSTRFKRAFSEDVRRGYVYDIPVSGLKNTFMRLLRRGAGS